MERKNKLVKYKKTCYTPLSYKFGQIRSHFNWAHIT